MIHFLKFNMARACSIVVLLAFIATSVVPPSYAQMVKMPEPGTIVGLTPAFTPAYLMGVTIDPKNALKFDFLAHKGNDTSMTEEQRKAEYTNLIKYFLASLATPNNDQWVNLSPYEGNRIIKDDFGVTEMGRDLLAQDYMLKQLTASLMHPDTELGKKFWAQVYEKAYQQYGSTDIPVDTFNKIWITADDASVYEKDNTAIIINSHLKIRTERDYMATGNNVVSREGAAAPAMPESARISAEIVKEIIIPAIEKEVNEGTTFANLRQIYSSMILAVWFKQQLKESILGKAYADRSKTKGLEQDPKNNEAIYQQYLASFKKGVFNMIKEDVDRYTNEAIPRKYFSGGISCPAQLVVDKSKKAESTAEGRVLSAAGAAELDDLKVAFADPEHAKPVEPVGEVESGYPDETEVPALTALNDKRKRLQEDKARRRGKFDRSQMAVKEMKSWVQEYLRMMRTSIDVSSYSRAVSQKRTRSPEDFRKWVQAEVFTPILRSIEPVEPISRANIVLMIQVLQRRLQASDAAERTDEQTISDALVARERAAVDKTLSEMKSFAVDLQSNTSLSAAFGGLLMPYMKPAKARLVADYLRNSTPARKWRNPWGGRMWSVSRGFYKLYYFRFRGMSAMEMRRDVRQMHSNLINYRMVAAFARVKIPYELQEALSGAEKFLESRKVGEALKNNTSFNNMIKDYQSLAGLMQTVYENSDPGSRLTVKKGEDAAENTNNESLAAQARVKVGERWDRMNSLAIGLKIPQGAKTGGIRRFYNEAHDSLYRFKTAKLMLEEAQRAFIEIKDYQMTAAFAGMRVPSALMEARYLFDRFLESRTAGKAFKDNTAFKDMVAAYTELTRLMQQIYVKSDPEWPTRSASLAGQVADVLSGFIVALNDKFFGSEQSPANWDSILELRVNKFLVSKGIYFSQVKTGVDYGDLKNRLLSTPHAMTKDEIAKLPANQRYVEEGDKLYQIAVTVRADAAEAMSLRLSQEPTERSSRRPKERTLEPLEIQRIIADIEHCMVAQKEPLVETKDLVSVDRVRLKVWAAHTGAKMHRVAVLLKGGYVIVTGFKASDLRWVGTRIKQNLENWGRREWVLDDTSYVVIMPDGVTIGKDDRVMTPAEARASGLPRLDASQVKAKEVGGIDFNEQYLKMNIKRDGNGVPLPVGQQDLDNIKIDGLVPVIMSITPVTALPTLN